MSRPAPGAGESKPGWSMRLGPVTLRRPELTGRRVVIGAFALFLVILLAPALQTYLSRRSSVAAAVNQRSQLQQQVAQLQQENAQWLDPAYIEQQARARLQYVRPGDTVYNVLGGSAGSPEASESTGSVASTVHAPSWNVTLWGSITNADQNQ